MARFYWPRGRLVDVAQTDCRIYRRDRGSRAWRVADGAVIVCRDWYAICPVCGEEISAGYRYYIADFRRSRKTAKDALHRHKISKHS